MITWTYEISIGDLLTAIAILIAAVGLFLNLLQMRKDSLQKRAEYIINLYNQYASDPDMVDIYYKIEYGEFEYDEKFYGSPDQKKLDKLLGFFQNIAKLYVMQNITMDDLKYVTYEFLVLYKNDPVQEYLKSLDQWYQKRGIKIKSYKELREVGNLLEKEMCGYGSNIA